ncbi:protein of unknown function [Microbacterium sp. Nx66]|nr:protein of unknown function [Microbacterium sp. Nx66]
MKDAVGGERRARRDRLGTVESRHAPTRLVDDGHGGGDVVFLHIELGDGFQSSLRQEHVRIDIAVRPIAPDVLAQTQQGVQLPGVAPLGDALETHAGLIQRRDGGGGEASLRAVIDGPGAVSRRRPPPSTERRHADHADPWHTVDRESDHRAPQRDAPEEVRRAVDRIDDPLPRGAALGAELLAEDAVVGTFLLEESADRALRGEVGVGHVGVIRLRGDHQIGSVEPGERLRVRGVGEAKGELEIGAQVSGVGSGGHALRIVAVIDAAAETIGQDRRAKRPSHARVAVDFVSAPTAGNVIPRSGLSRATHL